MVAISRLRFRKSAIFFRVLSKPPPAPPYNVSHPRVERTVKARGARRASLRPVRSHAKGWAGLGTHTKVRSIFIYSRWCEPSPAQKNLLQTRRKLCFCMRWALNPCPLRSCIRIETARRVSLDSSDMSEWARLMGRSRASVEDVHFDTLHSAASD